MTVVALPVAVAENLIGGVGEPASDGATFEKLAPSTGDVLCLVPRSRSADVDRAVEAAVASQPDWASRTAVERGAVVRALAGLLEDERDPLAEIISVETGKPYSEAEAEVDAAIEFGYFMAGEGRRLYGKTMPSATANRQALTIRQPLGVAGLIVAANTPLATIVWKVFPALSAAMRPCSRRPSTRRSLRSRSAASPPPACLPPY